MRATSHATIPLGDFKNFSAGSDEILRRIGFASRAIHFQNVMVLESMPEAFEALLIRSSVGMFMARVLEGQYPPSCDLYRADNCSNLRAPLSGDFPDGQAELFLVIRGKILEGPVEVRPGPLRAIDKPSGPW